METKKCASKLDSYFEISKNGSTIKKELIAGLVTFLAMAYILTVNPNALLGSSSNPLWSSVFMATAFGAIIGTLLMAFVAKMPFAQASGMGLNFAVGALLGSGLGLSLGNILLLVFISGLIFLLVSIVPCGKNKETGKLISLREKIFEGIPTSIKTAITVALGLFIAYIGLKNCGLANGSSLVNFGDLFRGKDGIKAAAPALTCLVGLISIAILSHYKVQGAVIIGILIATLFGLPFGVTSFDVLLGKNEGITWKFWENFGNYFSLDSNKSVFLSMFTTGFDFSGVTASKSIVGIILTNVLSFAMIDMFDTMGTVVGCAQQANLLDNTGKPLRYNRIMISDSVATVTGAMVGTSTVTTFVESSAGVAAGGKTGLTALSTASMFLLSLFALPIFAFIPSAAASSALLYVGVLMMSNVKNIDFKNIRNAVPAFVTIIIMVCAYSITDGIGMGIITYVLMETVIYLIDLIKYLINKSKYEKPKYQVSIVTIVVFIFFLIDFFEVFSFIG